MKGKYLTKVSGNVRESNIFANKSSLVLDWLLRLGTNKNHFALREVVKDTHLSLGLVQKVFSHLVYAGILEVEGVRTAKKFRLKKPKLLVEEWLKSYSLLKKCKIKTYASPYSKAELLNRLENSSLHSKVGLALHSAAESLNLKNTNLNSLELYVMDEAIIPKIEKLLKLEVKERGYDVLLIIPYYSSLLAHSNSMQNNIKVSPPLLTYLDLYHFPLRGQEQAEFLGARIPDLKDVLPK